MMFEICLQYGIAKPSQFMHYYSYLFLKTLKMYSLRVFQEYSQYFVKLIGTDKRMLCIGIN